MLHSFKEGCFCAIFVLLFFVGIVGGLGLVCLTINWILLTFGIVPTIIMTVLFVITLGGIAGILENL